MLKLVFFIVFYGTLAIAQEHHCVAPLHFEALLLQYDHLTNFYRRGRMFYDGIGERLRFVEETSENQTRPAEDILILFRQKKQYTVDLKTQKCVTSLPMGEFHRIGVQDGYQYVEDLMIGTEGDGVVLTVWGKNENSTDVSGISVVNFTRRDCLPFYHSFEGEIHGQKVHYHRDYFNIKLGEVHPDVFDIPKECISGFVETIF